MSRKPKNAPDELDQLLIDAQRIRSDKDRQGTSLPAVSISKPIMEFAQSFKAIKYREMREMLSVSTKCRKLESQFFKIAAQRLPFKPDNWLFFLIKGQAGISPPGLIPQTFEDGRGLVARVEEIKALLESDPEVRSAYDAFEICWIRVDHLSYELSNWIHNQFKNGTLEKKIATFRNERETKRKTTLSKAFVSNLIDPNKADIVKKTGELPDLSVGERQALQFLLGKINNMSDREQYLKEKLLDGDEEDPKKHGYFVVFEQTEALRQSYGNVRFDGYHYDNLEQSLFALLEKKRKLLIETKKDTLELSLSLLQKLEMRHKFHEEPEFRSYIAVRIPYEVVQLHDKRYTSYPEDHFALIRNTPPKTLLDKTEIRFFDFLRDEAPYKGKPKTLRKLKEPFLDLIGGSETTENRNKSRLAERIDTYILKAVNMGLLKSGKTETNAKDEEVYVLEYAGKD